MTAPVLLCGRIDAFPYKLHRPSIFYSLRNSALQSWQLFQSVELVAAVRVPLDASSQRRGEQTPENLAFSILLTAMVPHHRLCRYAGSMIAGCELCPRTASCIAIIVVVSWFCVGETGSITTWRAAQPWKIPSMP